MSTVFFSLSDSKVNGVWAFPEVTGSFLISVVAKMNFTCGGGSSSVFRERVERRGREHVNFVDDVDLVASLDRRVADALDQFPDVADAGARGGVHLEDVGMPALGDSAAMAAFDGKIDRWPVILAVLPYIVERARENARRRRLPDAPTPVSM